MLPMSRLAGDLRDGFPSCIRSVLGAWWYDLNGKARRSGKIGTDKTMDEILGRILSIRPGICKEPIKTAIIVSSTRFLGKFPELAWVKCPMKSRKRANAPVEFLRPKIKRLDAAADRVSSENAGSVLRRRGIR